MRWQVTFWNDRLALTNPPCGYVPLRQAVVPVGTQRHYQYLTERAPWETPTSELATHTGPWCAFQVFVPSCGCSTSSCFPWFAVRNTIRCNDHDTLGWSWRYFALRPPVPCGEQEVVRCVRRATNDRSSHDTSVCPCCLGRTSDRIDVRAARPDCCVGLRA